MNSSSRSKLPQSDSIKRSVTEQCNMIYICLISHKFKDWDLRFSWHEAITLLFSGLWWHVVLQVMTTFLNNNRDCYSSMYFGFALFLPWFSVTFQVYEFMAMALDMKTHLKWKLLLERCAVRILVLRSSSDRPHPLISLLSCIVADPSEAAACIPVYWLEFNSSVSCELSCLILW